MNEAMRTKEGEFAPYYGKYVDYTIHQNIAEMLVEQINELRAYCAEKNESWFMQPYQEGKWTPKELIGHLIDTDRIFAYRALCLARGENGMLPGFDENAYVDHADFNSLPVSSLLDDFEISRKALHSMINNFSRDVWQREGLVNGNKMTCRAVITIIPGHFIHHMNVLKERY